MGNAWKLGTLTVDLRFFHAKDGNRVEREIACSAPLTEGQRARLAEIAEKTPVTLALKSGMRIATRLA